MQSRFHRLLAAKLAEVIVNRSEDLTSGLVKNYEEYKYNVGYIQAIRDVLKICEDIDEDEFGHSK